MVSSSPERHTFHVENYIKRCEDKGEDPREDYLNLFKSAQQQDEENVANPEWQKDNMEYDLRSTQWIIDKVKGDEVYAQNLYASMCNNDFTKNDVIPILTEKKWSCSWRYAGGIIAAMKEEGDYIDWYCSGIQGEPDADWVDLGHVPEGTVTDEIQEDLLKLGWIPREWDDDGI